MKTPLPVTVGTELVPARPEIRDEDQAKEVWVWLIRLRSRFRLVDETVVDALIEYIEENGSFQVGDKTVRAGWSKTEKVKDMPATVDALLSYFGGDIEEFVKTLRSDSIKPGAVGKLVSKEFREQHFQVTSKKKLDDAVARKSLYATDERFLRGMR